MVNRDQNSLEHKLALLKQTYQQNLQKELASLCHVLQTMQQTLRAQLMASACERREDEQQASREVLTDVYRRLHKLAGSAGTFGFDAIGSQARILEGGLKRWLEESDQAIDLQLVNVVSSQLQSMQVELAPSLQTAPVIESPQEVGSSSVTIWLIEEDANLGRHIREQLTNFSYDVRLFTSVPDACQHISEESPDILIVDAMAGVGHLSPLQALSCPLLFISDCDTFDARMRVCAQRS